MNDLEMLKNEVSSIMENDPAHDFEHVLRVYKNARRICKKEKADEKLVLAAVLLHDIASYPKSDPRSKLSSHESSEKSKQILKKYSFSRGDILIISDAIRDHSFSQGKVPETLEGKIVQDADRLDALGAIGIARVFSTGGLMNRHFYDPNDPFCNNRLPDDKIWTVDHFFQKLLKLESQMNTKSGKIEAVRTNLLRKFLNHLKREL